MKGLEILSSTAMPLHYYSLLGSLMYLGVTVRYFVLNSYCLNSEIGSAIKTLVDRSSAHSYVRLAYKKWVTQLQNYEQLVESSGRLIPKMVPNFVCQPHWRKAGWLSEDVLGIFTTILKGEM